MINEHKVTMDSEICIDPLNIKMKYAEMELLHNGAHDNIAIGIEDSTWGTNVFRECLNVVFKSECIEAIT